MHEPAKLEPCKSFMVVPPIGAAFEDPALLSRLQTDLNEAFPDFQFVVMIEGAPGRYADFYIVPIVVDYGDGVGDSGPSTVSNKTLHDLACLLAPYVGSDDRVDLIVKMGPAPDDQAEAASTLQ